MLNATAYAQEIVRLLRRGPQSAAQLLTALRVSQPTLSRTIRSLSQTVTSFRVRGERTPLYALLRQLPIGLNARQPIYRLNSDGKFAQFADVEFLSGGATLERIGTVNTLYEGLPPYMKFAAPSGFLGRQQARDAAQGQNFPESLKDWGDEHVVAYLFSRGVNLPGNLVFGAASHQLEMDLRNVPPTLDADRAAHYLARATTLKDAAYGSSAGGEQPKFLGITEGAGHVIVKFARADSRMGELLPLEHLALRCLNEVGVPSSPTRLVVSGDYVFLEVKRFDRILLSGRVGMLSAGAIDDEYFGMRDTWSEFATRCKQAKYLSDDDVLYVDTMAAFSELIGNTDRHFENISVLVDDDSEYKCIAPAYDILPMRYATIGGGVNPPLTPIAPRVGSIGAKPEVWSRAAQAAERFWVAVQTEQLDAPISNEMRALATENLAVVKEFVAPLLPAAPAVASASPKRSHRPRPG